MDSKIAPIRSENFSKSSQRDKDHSQKSATDSNSESLDHSRLNHDNSSNEKISQDPDTQQHAETQIQDTEANCHSDYLSSWRLHGVTLGCLLAIFLVNLEISIVSTALIVISSDFKSYDQSSWIVTGFLSTYTTFLIIATKLTDIFTYKSVYLGHFLIFLIFSGACGGAQNMQQLIAFRVFQGLGAAGTYTNTVLCIYKLVPPSKWPLYGAMVAVALLVANAIGPIVGGAIARQGSSWRWIFYINLPIGVVAAALLQLCMPSRFPEIGFHRRHSASPSQSNTKLGGLTKIDYLGAALLSAGTVLLLIALFEGSTISSWSATTTIGCFCGAGGAFIAFFIWERHITLAASMQEPVFPWRFFYNHAWMGMLLTTFIAGFPFNIIVINFPQSFQILAELSPLQAGLRLLPYMVGLSISAMIFNTLCSKFKIAFIYILLFGACLQTIALGVLVTTTSALVFPAYGYFVVMLAGFALGGVFSILILATPFIAEQRDLAVAAGAIVQLRFFGGAIGLAIATALSNYYIRWHLQSVLNTSDLTRLLQDASTIHTFPRDTKLLVQMAFLEVYRQNFVLITCLSVVQILAAGLLWRKSASGGQYRLL